MPKKNKKSHTCVFNGESTSGDRLVLRLRDVRWLIGPCSMMGQAFCEFHWFRIIEFERERAGTGIYLPFSIRIHALAVPLCCGKWTLIDR